MLIRILNYKIGDLPFWTFTCALLVAVVCKWLGVSWAGSFVIFLGVTGVVAILCQLDSIEADLKKLNQLAVQDKS